MKRCSYRLPVVDGEPAGAEASAACVPEGEALGRGREGDSEAQGWWALPRRCGAQPIVRDNLDVYPFVSH
jgi:hypothetical protein